MSFTIGSLFDGSGGFPLAATLCGGTPKWASEIEPYPIAVTKSKFPNVKHLGSVTDIKGGEVEPVDVITFGSPCQDLSVAGKRAGLKHEANGDDETTRSGLFMEAVRIIKEMREATNGVYPRFALWENVPGAFSSNKGEDFRIVLEELIKVVEPTAVMPEVPKNGWPYADSYCGNGWSLAYRVLDAQFWGVPQRRRRIYLVADFRGECAGKVSFECKGLRGYFTEGRTPWQATPGDAEGGSGATDCKRNSVVYSINHQGGNVEQIIEDKTGTLTAAMNSSGNNKLSVAYALEPGIAAREGGHIYEGVSGTLRANAGDNQMAVAYADMVLDDQGGQQISVRDDGKCPTLRAETHGNLPCVLSIENHPADSRVNIDESGKVQTLTSRMGTGGGNVPMVMESQPVVYDGANVTSPINASNPQPGDPCHTLSTDSRNILVAPIYCLQGGGATSQNSQGMGHKMNTSYTLNTTDVHAVAYWDGGQTMSTLTANNAGGNQRMPDKENFNCVIETHSSEVSQDAVSLLGDKVAGTLMARDYKGIGRHDTLGSAVCIPTEVRYIVRRLTPTECARLQGFPDTWGHPIEKTELTDEEHQFWQNVRNTHAAINDKPAKDYTKDQILKWYNGLHTDSSEYKMWGNGIALPNALYMMQGIAEVMSEEKAARRKWLNDLLGGCL